MKGLLPWVLLVLAVLATSASGQDMSQHEVEEMSDKVLRALSRQIDRLGEDEVEDDDENPRGKVVEAVKGIGKKLAGLVKNIWKKLPRDKMQKAVKSTITEVKNTIKQKGKEKLAEMKEKLIKEGKKQAKSFLKHEILKYIKKKSEKEVCECSGPLNCGCCIQPKGLEQGCLNMTALVNEKKFRVRLSYGGEKIVGRKIAGTEEMMSCVHLPTPLNLVEICIVTQGIQEIDPQTFKGCFRIVSHGLEMAKCLLYESGKASLV